MIHRNAWNDLTISKQMSDVEWMTLFKRIINSTLRVKNPRNHQKFAKKCAQACLNVIYEMCFHIIYFAQLAGAVEYTDSTSAEG